jgi:hypothetical protein
MKIKLKEKILIEDYVHALTSIEKILWQGEMGKPLKYLENYNPSSFPESYFVILSILLSFTIANGAMCFLLFCYSIPSSMFLIHRYHLAKKQKLEVARKETQYFITNKRIIFILYHNETISIQSILYENIKKFYINKELGNTANICFTTNEPVDFQTFKFWSQTPHDKIVMVQVEEYQRALDLIQEHLV